MNGKKWYNFYDNFRLLKDETEESPLNSLTQLAQTRVVNYNKVWAFQTELWYT